MKIIKAVTASLLLSASAMSASAANIVEVAQGAGQFKTLLAAATAAGLAPTLAGKGPYTVFAPTDAAFAKLPKGTVATLLKPENKRKLAKILKYHVVAGEIEAADIKPGRSRVKTVSGQSITVKKHGGVRVNNARVVSADVQASNGVIHVIDKVLLPH
jgi:uncharacterized surface protein with fasciclin (FAS1) repeats